MKREFWSELLTTASFQKLQELASEFDFVLIGGWAAYLWTKSQKSKDIDIVVDYEGLAALKRSFPLSKNERMRKYEIKLEKFDIDIYVAHYSRLAIAPEELLLKGSATKLEGVRTVKPEILLILKQAAEIDRRGSPKGKKDSLDILGILLFAPIDWKKYTLLLEKHGLEKYAGELVTVVSGFNEQDLDYLGIGFMEFKKWRKETVSRLRNLMR